MSVYFWFREIYIYTAVQNVGVMPQSPDRLVLSYGPEDFYYLDDKENMPNCDAFMDLPEYQQQLCMNKELVGEMLKTQQMQSSMEKKIHDYQSKYYSEVLKSFNLGIGIVGLISFLYYNQGD